VKRYFRDCAWTVRIPRRLQEMQGTIATKLPLLEQELNREPTPVEIAEHLGVDVSDVEQALAAKGCFNVLSLDRPADVDADLTLADVVADLNIDMVGRNSKDTVAVIGREHSNLGVMLDSVAAAHRELNIKPVGDLWPQEGLFFRSDHYNFAKKGVPILFFTTGLHPDYHQVSDSPEKIDAEKEARFARLMVQLGLAVANTPQRPRWKPESYKQIVGGGN